LGPVPPKAGPDGWKPLYGLKQEHNCGSVAVFVILVINTVRRTTSHLKTLITKRSLHRFIETLVWLETGT
jgi:hypothetical protein